MLKKVVFASTFALLIAAPVQAQSRDMGAGRLIAAQGNQALRVIQEEAKQAIRDWTPALPAPAQVRTVQVAVAAGPNTAVRSAP